MTAALLVLAGLATPAAAQPAAPLAPERDPAPRIVVQGVMTFGSSAETDFDRALESHGHSVSNGHWGGDGTMLFRTAPWLFLGGRAGVRQRSWRRVGEGDVLATGADLQAIAEGRWQLGRVVSLGIDLGLGAGHVTVAQRETAIAGAAPRFSVGGWMAYRLTLHLHGLVRAGWEYFRWVSANRLDHDVDVGGTSVSLGIELRS